MAVPVKPEPDFRLETPKVMFRGNYAFPAANIMRWDISLDGKRFLLLKPPESVSGAPPEGGLRKINIVLDWLDELKQRVLAN
jgi:hypothetical protein